MSHIIKRSKNGQNPIFSRKLENSHSSPHFYQKKLKIRLLTKKWHFWTFWLILADFLKMLGRGSPLFSTSALIYGTHTALGWDPWLKTYCLGCLGLRPKKRTERRRVLLEAFEEKKSNWARSPQKKSKFQLK